MNNNAFSDVGKKLRELRKKNNLTLNDVGKQLHLTGQAVGNYETGKRDLSFSLAIEFAKLYNVPVSSLLDNYETFEKNIITTEALDNMISTNAYLEKNFDVLISGNISKQAYEEIMTFVEYIKSKYGYNKN